MGVRGDVLDNGESVIDEGIGAVLGLERAFCHRRYNFCTFKCWMQYLPKTQTPANGGVGMLCRSFFGASDVCMATPGFFSGWVGGG